jgi:signal transduction histidine kinase
VSTTHPIKVNGKRAHPLTSRLTHSRSTAWAALALALAVLGITVAGGTLHLRHHLREHLVQRDGEILTTVALARQYANGSGTNLTKRLGNPADQLALMLEISQIKVGVLGVRLFDREGRFETAFPPTMIETNLLASDLSTLRKLQPISRYHERASLADFFLIGSDARLPGTTAPLLEVNIPLHARDDPNLVATAQLLLDGTSLSGEYARVDSHLWPLALGLYAGGAALLSGVLIWAYCRLRKAHALVEERTTRLLRANHELAMAAKTNALGSVTAHLIHGLSNPLANLQDFLTSHGSVDDLQTLAASTRRMQQLVHEVVRVLGEERGGEHYEISLSELSDVLNGKLAPAVKDGNVHMVTVVNAPGNLSNRHANLVVLILENLLHNALKVTPAGGVVCVRVFRDQTEVCCEVIDQGPGIPAEVLPRLFIPCHSTQGGSGLGLAISKQLANQLGATLELKSSSQSGCVFELRLPEHLVTSAEQIAQAGS